MSTDGQQGDKPATDQQQERKGLLLGDYFFHQRTQARFVVTGVTRRMRPNGQPPRLIVEIEPAAEQA